MILIISTVKDQSTSEVIEWIVYNNHPFVLIDELNKLVSITWSFEHGYQTTILKTMRGEEVDLKNVNAVWYRRGRFFIDYEVNSNCGLPPAPSDLDFDREFELSPESIDLFPNPANETIHINVSNQPIKSGFVTDMQGKILKQLPSPNSENIQWEVSDWPSGTYVVYLLTVDDVVHSGKFVNP